VKQFVLLKASHIQIHLNIEIAKQKPTNPQLIAWISFLLQKTANPPVILDPNENQHDIY
jgi:hypothetical protein